MAQRRYELTDFEWCIIAPLLLSKPRGFTRVDDRWMLSGIYWRLRTGFPEADIPEGPIHHLLQSFRQLGVAWCWGTTRKPRRAIGGSRVYLWKDICWMPSPVILVMSDVHYPKLQLWVTQC